MLSVVGFGALVAADDLTVVATMLRPIIGDLGIVLPDGLDDAAWIVNVYLIAFVAVMPIAGKLSDVWGRRAVFIGALGLFAAGSTVIAFASTLPLFLFGRVLSAIGGGALIPVAMAVVGDVYPERHRARALGILGSIETMGWVIGPIYGALLVRLLNWRWQFGLNVPLALIGILAGWNVLDAGGRARRRVDWSGATALVVGLVALNVALIGRAQIQSVTGLSELTGEPGFGGPWLYGVAAAAFVAFVWRERRSSDRVIDPSLLRGRNLRSAVAVNFLIGAALVIAMVQVPLWVNVVEIDTDRSAALAARMLTAMTVAMALTSYLGGRLTSRWWYRPPTLAGLALAGAGFWLMGSIWEATTGYAVMAMHLALVGAGLGMVIAPTSAAVVDHAPGDQRGAAAGVVMLFRLMGLSVGLSALTAWGLRRFNQLRTTVELPPLTDPGFRDALLEGERDITTAAIGEMFSATVGVMAVAFAVALLMRRPSAQKKNRTATARPKTMTTIRRTFGSRRVAMRPPTVPPTRLVTAMTAARSHWTLPLKTKKAAATRLMQSESVDFSELMRGNGSSSANPRTARSMMPSPAPK